MVRLLAVGADIGRVKSIMDLDGRVKRVQNLNTSDPPESRVRQLELNFARH